MITSGHFIGEIIDELSMIASQVENRCALNLTDLNIFLENFFKEVLNKILGLKLDNLNKDRSNEPGLDLGDKIARVAFQVTANKRSDKINMTLQKVIENKINDYDDIKVLVIGTKQKTYSLNSDLCKNTGFSEDKIWDIRTLCKKIIDLRIDALSDLHAYIKSEVTRVRVQLEISDSEGNYPTSVMDYVEAIPKPSMSDFKAYHAFHKTKHPEWELTIEDVQKDFDIFISSLLRLPRITKEFYSFLLQRRDEGYDMPVGGSGRFRFNLDRLTRICRYSDLDGEIRLVKEYGFVDIIESEEYAESPYLEIYVPGKSDYFTFEFVEFVEERKVGFQKPVVGLDFSSF